MFDNYSLTINDDATDLAVTTPQTTYCEPIENLDGMSLVTLQVRFAYGSGGTSVKVYVQTSLDDGETWIDIACFTFTTVAANKVRNLSKFTPKVTDITPSDGALTDDTSVDGILGDRLRARIVSTGTYANTTIGVRAAVS